MNAEIITVGTELLLGEIVNTNARYLAEELAACGINAYYQSTVGDNADRLKRALMLAGSRSDIIIITGGLGPTDDDITKQTVADAIGVPLVEDARSLERIKDYFKRTGRAMTENNIRQAMIPEGAEVFDNDFGTAPGCALVSPSQCIILLPGPPRELRPMFETYVKPFLARYSEGVLVSHTVRVFGMGEAQVADRLGDVFGGENPTVGIYAGDGEVRLRVTASADNSLRAEQLCAPVMERILSTLGAFVYGVDRDSLEQVVVEGLKKNGLVLATAESCTAGLLSKRITDIPGSSSVFHMGVTAYANEVKTNVLGVPAELIRAHGAVSDAVARRMAVGVQQISGADLGVSVTGVAGDPVESKPSGLVYLAMTDGKRIWTKKLTAGRRAGERDYVRQLAASHALDLVRRYLDALPGVLPGGEPLDEEAAAPAVATAAVGAAAIGTVKAAPAAQVHAADIEFDPDHLAFGDREAEPKEFQVVIPEEKYRTMDFADLQAGAEPDDADAQESAAPFDEDFVLSKAVTPQVESEPEPEPEKPRKWYMRALHYLIPWKGDPAREIVRKSVFLVAAVALIVSGAYLCNHFLQKFSYEKAVSEAREIYDPDNNTILANGIQAKFEELYKQNSDLRAWITILNTKVDNPVYQAKDNDFYIHHDMNKQRNVYGALFLDYRDTVSATQNNQNQVIYGHHMKDGSMLAQIKNYRDVNFYKENPTLTYDTLYRDGTYKVFAAFITNAEKKDDDGYYFDYCVPEFANQTDFLAWIEQVRRRSLINTPVDVLENDEILTLSTCTYELSGVELRFVVMARRVRDGESEQVNVAEAKQNGKPLYPAVWYERKGSSKPVFEDGLYQWYPGSTVPVEQEPDNTASTATQAQSSQPATSSDAASSGASSAAASSKPVENSKPAESSSPAASSQPAQSSSQPAASSRPSESSRPPAVSSTPDSSREPVVSATPEEPPEEE